MTIFISARVRRRFAAGSRKLVVIPSGNIVRGGMVASARPLEVGELDRVALHCDNCGRYADIEDIGFTVTGGKLVCDDCREVAT